MKASLISFKQGLEDLESHIKELEMYSKLLSCEIESPHSFSEKLLIEIRDCVDQKNKKRFDYTTIIVSLYGFFEQYIESMLSKYVSYINKKVKSYLNLPDTIRKNHVDFSFELAKYTEHSKYNGFVTKESIIMNLHSCVKDKSYKLNTHAYTMHTSNFRPDVINSSFSRVGINNISQKVQQHEGFAKYLSDEYKVDIATLELKEDLLSDLVERRNEVSHGNAINILSNELLLVYIKYVRYYGEALYDIVQDCTLPFEVKHNSVELGSPIAVYNNRIVCLALSNIKIKVGNILIAETQDQSTPYLCGRIKEIQINKKSQTQVEVQEQEVKVGLRVEFNVKENQKFYLVKS